MTMQSALPKRSEELRFLHSKIFSTYFERRISETKFLSLVTREKMMNTIRNSIFTLILGGTLNAASAAPNWYYEFQSATLVDLGTLPNGTSSFAWDINDGGAVVGESNVNGVPRAFGHFFGYMFPINDGGSQTARSIARGINNNNEVVGYLHRNSDPSVVDKAWYWKIGMDGVYLMGSNPDAPALHTWSTRAFAISNNGVIVGNAKVDYNSGGDPFPNLQGDCYTSVPVRWGTFLQQVSTIFCGKSGNYNDNFAYDVNDSDTIVGIDNGVTQFQMFSKLSGNVFPTSVPETSNPSQPNIQGTKYGEAYGVSNTGYVTGMFSIDGVRRAFLWNGTSANSKDLGVLSGGNWSEGRKVNNQGFVAGFSNYSHKNYLSQTTVIRKAGFIYGANIGMIKLPNFSPWYAAPGNCEAYSLNNRNESTGRIQVVGYCETAGTIHAVRWDVVVAKKYVSLL